MIARVSGAGIVDWTREIALQGCKTTLAFSIEQDANGIIYVGGQAEKCSDDPRSRGYIARLGSNGIALSIIELGELDQVRSLTTRGGNILASGGVHGGSAVVSLTPSGVRLWTRSSDDFNFDATIESIAAGAGGIYICGADYHSRQLLLAKLDEKGGVIRSWKYPNRSTPTLAPCLIADPLRGGLVLLGQGSGTREEVVRIPSDGAPTPGVIIDNKLGFTRGYGISGDGLTLYIGGPDNDKGPSRTQILRYVLPASQSLLPVAGACLSPDRQARIYAKKRLADEAERAAQTSIAARFEALLQETPWTTEQKNQSRMRYTFYTESDHISQKKARIQQFHQQLTIAGPSDCSDIEFRLILELESLPIFQQSQAKRADQVARDALYLSRPDGAAPASADLQHLQYRWTQTVQSRSSRYLRWPSEAPPPPGVCRVDLTLSAEGSLLDLRVIESSGNPEFDAVVLSALRQGAPYPPVLPPLTSNTAIRIGFRGK